MRGMVLGEVPWWRVLLGMVTGLMVVSWWFAATPFLPAMSLLGVGWVALTFAVSWWWRRSWGKLWRVVGLVASAVLGVFAVLIGWVEVSAFGYMVADLMFVAAGFVAGAGVFFVLIPRRFVSV